MRVTFLVDGFNLYNSLRDAKAVIEKDVRWLDLSSLCSSYLPLIGKSATLEKIYCFSALTLYKEHYSIGTIERHKTYIECLEDSGINITMGRFREKQVTCRTCNTEFTKHEEKETDVSIAVTLMELVFSDMLDVAVLLTGDTDLIPAIRKVNLMFPDKKIVALMPFKRKHQELADKVWRHFGIKAKRYLNHQLTDPYLHSDDRRISKPISW